MAQTLDEKPVLLIVEGKQDVAFFNAITKYLGLSNIQIKDIGGKTQLSSRLENLTLSPYPAFENIIAIGIIRDADISAKSEFQSVCSALKKAGLPVPKKQLEIVLGKPHIAVMIVPSGQSSGMLEDICLASINETEILECVDEYLDCLPQRHEAHVIPKAKLQIYLAAKKPELRLGEAAEAGYWNWEHPVFEPIKDFLRQLSTLPKT